MVGRDGVRPSVRPESVLSAHEDAAGSRASLAAGEINRPLTTQLPAAASAAARQPGQMRHSRVSSSHIVFFLFLPPPPHVSFLNKVQYQRKA